MWLTLLNFKRSVTITFRIKNNMARLSASCSAFTLLRRAFLIHSVNKENFFSSRPKAQSNQMFVHNKEVAYKPFQNKHIKKNWKIIWKLLTFYLPFQLNLHTAIKHCKCHLKLTQHATHTFIYVFLKCQKTKPANNCSKVISAISHSYFKVQFTLPTITR